MKNIFFQLKNSHNIISSSEPKLDNLEETVGLTSIQKSDPPLMQNIVTSSKDFNMGNTQSSFDDPNKMTTKLNEQIPNQLNNTVKNFKIRINLN